MINYFTSESVSEGHPDKLADQISDGVLDAFLKEDKTSRVACEVFLVRNLVIIAGEFKSKASVDVIQVARDVIQRAGYDDIKKGLDYKSCSVIPYMQTQSNNISEAVGSGVDQGAGDQGIVFGYAIDETEEFMPLSILLSHQLAENLASLRKQGHKFLWPDSKTQVTVRYEGGKVKDVSTVLIATQHDPDKIKRDLKEFLVQDLIKPVIPEQYLNKDTKVLINPGGDFVIGGPTGDCGLTGRKVVVDSYGGHGSSGGGAFSGKDPSKIDRSGAYVARHIAKNLVAAGVARKCLIQIAYALGVSEPISVRADTFGTAQISESKIMEIISEFWSLKPSQIIEELNLLSIPYLPTATYGHFGRKEESFTWEKLNKVSKIQKKLKNLK